MTNIVEETEAAEQIKKENKDFIRFSCNNCGMCCCNSMLIPLSPLDIWWLRRRMQCTTIDLFNKGYVRIVIEEKTLLPRAIINTQETTLENGEKYSVCPFVAAYYVEDSVGRNDPCPCGSGEKFKKCCIDKKNKILCSIWEQRPATCRMHPLTYAIYWDNEAADYVASFDLPDESMCKGINNHSERVSLQDWINKDDKLKYALEYNLKFAHMLKDIRAKSFHDGEIKHDHINVLANILYNFDAYAKPQDIKTVIFDRDAMAIVAELVLNFLSDPDKFITSSIESQSRIIIPGSHS